MFINVMFIKNMYTAKTVLIKKAVPKCNISSFVFKGLNNGLLSQIKRNLKVSQFLKYLNFSFYAISVCNIQQVATIIRKTVKTKGKNQLKSSVERPCQPSTPKSSTILHNNYQNWLVVRLSPTQRIVYMIGEKVVASTTFADDDCSYYV